MEGIFQQGTGADGAGGVKGDTGAQGAKGEKGEKGDKGDTPTFVSPSCTGQPNGWHQLTAGKSLCQDGWTLLLKTDSDRTLGFNDVLWTNTELLNVGDTTLDNADAKYGVWNQLPIKQLKATFPSKGEAYTFESGDMGTPRTAHDIFSGAINVHNPGGNSYASQWPSGWSTQPNCKRFGINLSDNYRGARVGFQANQENDCASHDTAAGIGIGPIGHSVDAERHGAGDLCQSSGCSHGNTNNGYQGLLWGR